MFDIELFLEKYVKNDEKIVLACSSGPDSMFLLYNLLKSKYKNNLVVCYFNHKLRVEADDEEIWLEELGKKLGFPVEIGSANIREIQKLYPSRSLEELAREKRYAFLNAVLNIYNSNIILTGHHLDDKIETFFFNLARGTKLTGLINMTEKNGVILRPLLNIEKSEILNYLVENKLEYRIDNSNFDTDITRNKLRHDIIPQFASINSNYKENISNLIGYLSEVKEFIDYQVKNFLVNSGEIIGENRFFYIDDFNLLSVFLQREIISHIYYISNGNSTIGLSEANIAEVIKFINGKNNKTIKEIKNMKLKKENKVIMY